MLYFINRQWLYIMTYLESNSELWGKQVSHRVLDPRKVLETILTNSTDAVLSIGPTGRILALNKKAEQLFEITEALPDKLFAD